MKIVRRFWLSFSFTKWKESKDDVRERKNHLIFVYRNLIIAKVNFAQWYRQTNGFNCLKAVSAPIWVHFHSQTIILFFIFQHLLKNNIVSNATQKKIPYKKIYTTGNSSIKTVSGICQSNSIVLLHNAFSRSWPTRFQGHDQLPVPNLFRIFISIYKICII